MTKAAHWTTTEAGPRIRAKKLNEVQVAAVEAKAKDDTEAKAVTGVEAEVEVALREEEAPVHVNTVETTITSIKRMRLIFIEKFKGKLICLIVSLHF
jgi:hypothetical protein